MSSRQDVVLTQPRSVLFVLARPEENEEGQSACKCEEEQKSAGNPEMQQNVMLLMLWQQYQNL